MTGWGEGDRDSLVDLGLEFCRLLQGEGVGRGVGLGEGDLEMFSRLGVRSSGLARAEVLVLLGLHANCLMKLLLLEQLSNEPVLARGRSPGLALLFLRLVLLDLGVDTKTESSELMVEDTFELC